MVLVGAEQIREHPLTCERKKTFGHGYYRQAYTPDFLKRLIHKHHFFSQRHEIISPYFEFTGSEKPYLTHQFEDGTFLKVGPIAAFSVEEMAAFLETQMYLYVEKGTMGKFFPKKSKKAEQKLRAVMMGDFSADRVVVLHYRQTEDGFVPLAGVQAYWGSKEHSLEESIQQQAAIETSLSPFWASLINTNAEEVVQFLKTYGAILENQVVVMSRLFHQSKEVLQQYGSTQKDMAWVVMAALAEGIERHRQATQNLGTAKLVLYDTHSPKIQAALEVFFGMQILANQESVKPSLEVSGTVLDHHYGSQELIVGEWQPPQKFFEWIRVLNLGSFASQILIGFQELDKYLEKAQPILQDKNISVGQTTKEIT